MKKLLPLMLILAACTEAEPCNIRVAQIPTRDVLLLEAERDWHGHGHVVVYNQRDDVPIVRVDVCLARTAENPHHSHLCDSFETYIPPRTRGERMHLRGTLTNTEARPFSGRRQGSTQFAVTPFAQICEPAQ